MIVIRLWMVLGTLFMGLGLLIVSARMFEVCSGLRTVSWKKDVCVSLFGRRVAAGKFHGPFQHFRPSSCAVLEILDEFPSLEPSFSASVDR